jgi:chloramphenicol-sensitive protein RarD
VDRRGLLYGVLAYGLWGVVAVFWKAIGDVAPLEVLAHRTVWGLAVFAALVAITGRGPALAAAARDRRVLGAMAVSAVMLAINWGTFVGAVVAGHLLDVSLGYFINPLMSVALGTLVLRERLRRLQWVAIALATTGVALVAWSGGRPPWIALVLAATFAVYGLVRKVARVDSLLGSTIETAWLAPVGAAYLAYLASTGAGALGHAAPATQLLLVATGVVTAVPLLLFTSAARRLPLSTVGFLQYLAPTGQFLLAVLAYDEPFAHDKIVAFACIWLGLAVFSVDVWRASRPTPVADRR